MREEKEILWLSRLFNHSSLSNSKAGGSHKEFEEIANQSYLDKTFRGWFKKMVELDIINFLEYRENSKGSPTKIYVLKKNNIVKYLKQFGFYKDFRRIILDFWHGDML